MDKIIKLLRLYERDCLIDKPIEECRLTLQDLRQAIKNEECRLKADFKTLVSFKTRSALITRDRLLKERATTIPKGSTPKRVEAQDTTE